MREGFVPRKSINMAMEEQGQITELLDREAAMAGCFNIAQCAADLLPDISGARLPRKSYGQGQVRWGSIMIRCLHPIFRLLCSVTAPT